MFKVWYNVLRLKEVICMGLFSFGKKKKEEYDYIYNDVKHSDDVEITEPIFGEVYDDVYDEDGDFVNCICGGTIKWKDGVYICPDCGEVLNRAEFFNHIGAEPPGPECLTCANLYPGCIVCPHGYVED